MIHRVFCATLACRAKQSFCGQTSVWADRASVNRRLHDALWRLTAFTDTLLFAERRCSCKAVSTPSGQRQLLT